MNYYNVFSLCLIFFSLHSMELPQQKAFVQSVVLQEKLTEEENRLKKEEKKDELILLKIIRRQQAASLVPLAEDLILSANFFKKTFFDTIDRLQRDIALVQLMGDPKEAKNLIFELRTNQKNLIEYARNNINAIVKRYDKKQQLQEVEECFGKNSLDLLRATVEYNNQELQKQNLPPITKIQQIEQPRLIEEQKEPEPVEFSQLKPQINISEQEQFPAQKRIEEQPSILETKSFVEKRVQQPEKPSYFDKFYQGVTFVYEGVKSFFRSIFNFIFPRRP